MQEFDSVSAPASDPAALVAVLNARSALGWSVVGIVASGGDVTAYLSREASASAPAPVAEPTGWSTAPAQAAPMPVAAQPSPQPAAQPAVQVTPQPAAQPANTGVPANWYADPSGRFELRYWDGGQWTEHVSRGGQQFTDPPVA